MVNSSASIGLPAGSAPRAACSTDDHERRLPQACRTHRAVGRAGSFFLWAASRVFGRSEHVSQDDVVGLLGRQAASADTVDMVGPKFVADDGVVRSAELHEHSAP